MISELKEDVRDEKKIKDLNEKINTMESLHYSKVDDINNLNGTGWGSNEDGDEEIRQIFGRKVFDFPKPSKLILKLIASTRFENGYFLDSFAGTGTFGHAILRLNSQFGGNRKFILVELDEEIFRKITTERIKRVINGYPITRQNGEKENIMGLGGGFKYCKLNEPLFDEFGNIRQNVNFIELGHHIYFSETGIPLDKKPENAMLGIFDDTAYYLLFNGILGDRTVNGGNILTSKVLSSLPKFYGNKVIFGEGCRITKEKLRREKITFKQIPYEIKVN